MATDEKPKIGFIGLGRMGMAKAKHVIGAGYTVFGFDINDQAMEAATIAGVITVSSALEVAANSGIIIVIVPTDDDVKQVCMGRTGILSGAKKESIIVLCSSLLPETVTEITRQSANDVNILDVPSTRGPDAADAGTLALLVGGDGGVLDKVRPVVNCFSEVIHHVGPLGAGQIAKTVNNILLWCNMRTGMEVLTLAKELGLDPEAIRHAMFDCSGDSWALRRLDRINPAWPGKDMQNAMILSESANSGFPMISLMAELAPSLSQEAVDDLLEHK